MKAITVFIIISVLFFTFGCDYDYGKYGKDKTETTTEQKSEEGAPSN